VATAPTAAHPARGIAVAPDGRVYFSDLERIWTIGRDGRLSLLRENRGIHTHALAITRSGELYGEDSDYHPADQGYRESIWRITPQGRFSYVYGPTRSVARGVGLTRDGRGCSFHSDQTGQGGRPLVHRLCPGQSAERLVGSVADDRRFRPVLINDVAGTALAGGNFYFRQGDSVRKIARDGRTTLIASGLAKENFGIAMDGAGAIYVSEFSRRRLVRIAADGRRDVVATSAAPWGPTGVAASRGALYLLEWTEYRRGVATRVRARRIDPRGRAQVLAEIAIPLG
jgi:hypothetical protein